MIGTVIIVGEEIGWRGYLLPRFQQLTSKRQAAVSTGFAHGCFHLPLILLATTYDTGGSKWVAAPVAVAVITAGGVFYAWIWDRSHTVWPVAIAHNVVNTVFALGAAGVVATAGWNMAYVAGETGFATLGACVVAAVVLLRTVRVWGGRLRGSALTRLAPQPPWCRSSGHEWTGERLTAGVHRFPAVAGEIGRRSGARAEPDDDPGGVRREQEHVVPRVHAEEHRHADRARPWPRGPNPPSVLRRSSPG